MDELNRITAYIETHLESESLLEELEREVGMSSYHLKRVFQFVVGMSLVTYIKNRKLAAANEDLLIGDSVTDVAMKYGYDSVEGFSRAFRVFSGMLPSEIRKRKFQRTFPKQTFTVKVQGGISMDVRIEKKEAFSLIGVKKRVPLQFEGENEAIIELAKSITEDQRKRMRALGDLEPRQVCNASYHFEGDQVEEGEMLTQLIGFRSSQENPYEDLDQLAVPALTWAIFTCEGPFPQTMQETWAAIFAEWLPTAPYQFVEAPELSFTDYSTLPNAKSEIWIAVEEK